ncbi:MAG: hypothetical protein ABSG13_28980 [Bryobacteraceae bacterium]
MHYPEAAGVREAFMHGWQAAHADLKPLRGTVLSPEMSPNVVPLADGSERQCRHIPSEGTWVQAVHELNRTTLRVWNPFTRSRWC